MHVFYLRIRVFQNKVGTWNRVFFYQPRPSRMLVYLFMHYPPTHSPTRFRKPVIARDNAAEESLFAGASRMRKFDPWPVFFKREFNRNWPFLVGFAITGTIITKFSLGLTEEDKKNSVFAQRHKN
ncbi:hypothetical protein HanPI659440_Chr05g0187601 [Helianthus annuus]|nr:hypothetical protein HanPI659440_Chr05g0187601 [Helianthus annuus]